MGNIELRESSTVSFYTIRKSTWHDEDGYYAFLRPDTDDSILLKEWRVEAIGLLQQNHSIAKVAAQCHVTHAEVAEFITFLVETNFIKQIDGTPIPDKAEKIKPWLQAKHKKWFTWILNRYFATGAFLFICSGVAITIVHPEFIPTFNDFFWTGDLFTVIVVLLALDLVSSLLHEFGHFATTMAVGGLARIRWFDNRFLNLVFSTDNFHLSLVPRSRRYYVYLSGIMIDLFVISSLFWLFLYADWHHMTLGWVEALAKAYILVQIISIVWQFNVYLETDIYNFMSDFFNQQNLYNDTKRMIGNAIAKWNTQSLTFLKKLLLGVFLTPDVMISSDKPKYLSTEEKRKHKLFGICMVAGLLITLITFLSLQLPRDFIFIVNSATDLHKAAASRHIIEGLRSVAVIMLVLIEYVVLGLVIGKKIRRKRSFI
jgi:hypothetical protein